MITLAPYHEFTAQAGQVNYYMPRPRGRLEVWHDSKRYVYDIRGLKIGGKRAREFIESAWQSGNGIRIIGRFPSYEVESRP